MKAEALLSLYERVADAPDAFARLRRFVLDLAVRGKLVEQEEADEPASELLARIAAELAAASPKRGSKPAGGSSAVASDRLIFALPNSWQASTLGDITVCLDFMRKPINGAERELRIEGKPQELLFPYFGATQQQGWIDDYLFDEELILLGEDGVPFFDKYRAKAYLVSGKTWVNNHAHVFRAVLVEPRFLVHYLNVFDYTGRVAGATRSKLNQARALEIPVPVPPLAEQRRIVAKVDELMALLARLDAARSAREATRDRLTTASLTRLTAPDTDSEALRTHAHFAFDALPALTARADQIKQLRQTILDLAVRGMLSEQAEEASDLATEAESQASPAPGVPAGWRQYRLSALLAEDTRNGYSRRPDDAEDGVPILRISAGTVRKDGLVAEEEHKLISGIDTATRGQYGLRPGDLLACRFNGNKAYVGRLSLFSNYLGLDPIYPDKLIRIRLNPALATPAYVRLAGDSDLVRSRVELECATTVGNWGISASRLKEVNFPVPPLAEQHRIIAKVDELLALCDRLEAALQSADRTRASLLEALLHEALDSRADNVIDFAEARTRLRPTRSEVGSLIVHYQARRGQGGRIKLGKSLYLAEAHCGLALGGSFGRANFGPHDEWIYTFEREACHAGWFTVSERPVGNGNLRVEYTPGAALAAKADDARAALAESAAELERVLDLLAPLTAEEAEIVATLFAAWNDLLIEGGAVSDEVVITEVREHWHPSKARFTPDVLKQWLGWLRRNGLVPRGLGPSTRQQGRLI